LGGRFANKSKGETMSSIDRLFHFGTWVPEVWRNTIQRKEHEKDFEQALAEVHSLRKVLVMADRLLTEVETDGAIGYEYQKNMRAEINKAMSFTLNDEAAQPKR
jgi:hypothetical protein